MCMKLALMVRKEIFVTDLIHIVSNHVRQETNDEWSHTFSIGRKKQVMMIGDDDRFTPERVPSMLVQKTWAARFDQKIMVLRVVIEGHRAFVAELG